MAPILDATPHHGEAWVEPVHLLEECPQPALVPRLLTTFEVSVA